MPAPTLLELQRAFAASVFAGHDEPLMPWIAGHGLPPAERLTIYRNQVFAILSGALRTSYPAVAALLGEDCFDGVAARYVRAYPSTSGNLQDYGAGFVAFVADQPDLAALPYLGDVARLEWARQLACLAADAEPLSPGALGALPDTALPALTFTLHPSMRLVESAWPVLDLWRYCQAPTADGLRLRGGGQTVLLWRNGAQVAMMALPAETARLVAALRDGASLGTACADIVDASALAAAMGLLLGQSLVIGVRGAALVVAPVGPLPEN